MEEGDIIHVDYDLYNGETGDLIETTREATAQEHEMHDENRTYQPMVCVVGSGSLIPGFEEALLSAKVDKDVDRELAPADAYGEKDATQIETISIDKLRRAVRDPNALYLGAPVNIGGRQGYLSFLAADVHVSTTTTQWLVRPSSTTSRSLRSLKGRKRK